MKVDGICSFLQIIWLFLTTCITLSYQDCRVVSECDGGGLQWKDLRAHVASGMPGKRGAPGPRGIKGEPGVGVNIEEFKSQLYRDEGPMRYFYTRTITWESGKNFCQSLGKKLCSSKELCKLNNGERELLPDVLPGNNWVPVIDGHNQWLQSGTNHKRTCLLHHEHWGVPSWGMSPNAAAHKGYVYCCHENAALQPDSAGMVYKYIGKKATYASSHQHCTTLGLRLCYSSEVCKNNSPQFGVIEGDAWVAIKDQANEWIQIGNHLSRTCFLHGVHFGVSTWGTRTDDSVQAHVGYLICCPGEARR